ncbi:hypothetical protein BSLG_005160 [Batrachochytrium salamandrivorans]|nr:hypothetical protein BSLG_005160 [Batrachochytrium salamandrivorans]
MLLGPVMLYMWLMSALAIWAVFGVPWQLALIIAGCVTPTDPVLSNSIVKGTFAEKHILTMYGFSFLQKALKYAELNGWIDKESILGFFIAIALATTGLLATLGVDDVLGCFVVGTVLSWDQWFNQQIEETHIQEVLDAWFGPIGAGALFYAMIAIVYLEIDPKPLFPIVAFIILSSIILHGEQRQLQHERELRIRTNLEGNATSSTGVLFSGVGGFLRQFWTHSQPFTESPDRTNSVPSHFASSPMGDLARPSREHSAPIPSCERDSQDMDLLHTNGDSAVSTVRPPASPNGNLDTDTVMVDNVTGTTDATGGRSTSPLLMVHTS